MNADVLLHGPYRTSRSSLFLTNADDANAVRNDAVVEAIAKGYVEGIKAYFAKYPPS